MATKKVQHFIGGEFVASSNKETFPTVAPATEEVIADVALGGAPEVEAAVRAAQAAMRGKAYGGMTTGERCQMLKKIGDLIYARREELARLESLDTGKPLSETLTGDIARAYNNFYFYGELAKHLDQPTYMNDDGSVHTTLRQPLGVVGLITPWNLPLYLETWKLAPALAQGNAVILKPAELTPMTANALAEILVEAGVPKGAVNIVHGMGEGSAGEALVAHPDVAAISFTGETTTGKAIMKSAAATLKKVSFELGGKGASVIFADADLDESCATATRSAYRNQGQVCLAGSRLLVEEKALDDVLARMRKNIEKIVVGDPLDSKTTMGALISEEHREKVMSYVEYAREKEGIKPLVGGQIPSHLSKGYFYAPTILLNPKQDGRLIQEEIFGPVLTVQTFKNDDEAIQLLNGTPYGLSCSIFTQNMKTAKRMAMESKIGMVWINSWMLRDLHAAFGGAKKSGIGREGGRYSLDFFSELKTISTANGIW